MRERARLHTIDAAKRAIVDHPPHPAPARAVGAAALYLIERGPWQAWPASAAPSTGGWDDAGYWAFVERMQAPLEPAWRPGLGAYDGGTAFNANLLYTHAAAALAGHVGTARRDERARRIAMRLSASPPWRDPHPGRAVRRSDPRLRRHPSRGALRRHAHALLGQRRRLHAGAHAVQRGAGLCARPEPHPRRGPAAAVRLRSGHGPPGHHHARVQHRGGPRQPGRVPVRRDGVRPVVRRRPARGG